MAARTARRLLSTLVAAAALAAPAAAGAEVRTATLTDGVDPGVAFDIAQVDTVTDTAAGTVTVAATFHGPIPVSGRWEYFTVDLQDVLGTSCSYSFGSDGDLNVYVGFDLTTGALRASSMVSPGSSKTLPPPDVAADRRSVTLTVTDPNLVRVDHRCLKAAGSSGSGAYDSTEPVWVNGQAPPPTPPYVPTVPSTPPPTGPSPGPSQPASPGTSAQTPTPGKPAPSTPTDPCDDGALLLTTPGSTVRGSGPIVEVADATDVSHAFLTQTSATLRVLDAKTRKQRWQTEVELERIVRPSGGRPGRIQLPARATTRGAMLVTLTWKQQNRNGWNGECTAEDEIVLKRGTVARFGTSGGNPGRLVARDDCWDVRRQRVEVLVSGGLRTARFTRADPCDTFRGRTRRVGGVLVSASGSGRLTFETTRGSAMIVVRVGGRVVLHREVFARQVSLQDERTIWDRTAEFIDLCINAGRDIGISGNREYCVVEGQTGTTVAFRRIG